MEPRWDDTDRGNRKKTEKNLSPCYVPTTNPTWTDQGANPGLRGEMPVTNRLSRDRAESKI
jgi:hypothetical protein